MPVWWALHHDAKARRLVSRVVGDAAGFSADLIVRLLGRSARLLSDLRVSPIAGPLAWLTARNAPISNRRRFWAELLKTLRVCRRSEQAARRLQKQETQ